MIWFTSDCHFNHKKILEYEAKSRPFDNTSDMNETIISNWNNKVNKEDDIYVLGDFFMGCLEDIEPILSRLKGKIHLIRGNHDQNNRIRIFKEYGIDIQDIAYLKYKGKFFILCHFPMTDEEFKDDNFQSFRNYFSLWSCTW